MRTNFLSKYTYDISRQTSEEVARRIRRSLSFISTRMEGELLKNERDIQEL